MEEAGHAGLDIQAANAELHQKLQLASCQHERMYCQAYRLPRSSVCRTAAPAGLSCTAELGRQAGSSDSSLT